MLKKLSLPNMKLKEAVSGIIFALFLTLVFFLLIALLITFTSLSDKYLGVLVTASTILGVAMGSLKSARHVDSKGWLHGLIVGLFYAGIMILIGFIAIPGYSIHTGILLKSLYYTLAGILGGIVGLNL